MSVKTTQSYLTIFEQGNYLSFFKELVYAGVKFEVLNPDSLSSKWAEVEFIPNRTGDTLYLSKIDSILATTEKKGLFAAFIDTRPSVKLSEIQNLNSSNLRADLLIQAEELSAYIEQHTVYKKVQDLLKDNPEKSIVVGKNLLSFKDQLDVFGLKVIQEFRKNHDDQDIDQSVPEIDFISLGFKDCLIFSKENLEYVLGFQSSALGDFDISEATLFLKKQELELSQKKQRLNSIGCNPESLSKEKYKQFCILYSDLELENILIQSERFVFSLPDSKSTIKPYYAFISVHPDYLDKFEKTVSKNNLASEKVDWDKEIVVWQQSTNLNPFRAVAESLGTISSKETDPSLLISFFFSLFFAFCLGDAVYGLFLSLFCGYFLFFKRLKPKFENIFRLFFISGIATIVFGALLNSWAGDLFVKTPAGPLLEKIQLINPLDPNANLVVNKYLLSIGLSPIVALLGLSVVIGLVNIMSGYVLKAINEFKAGNTLNFISELNWITFLSALTIWIILAGVSPSLAIFALGTMLLTTIGFFIFNDGKGIVGKILSGFGKIYGLISFGADILSFTRLVAVGLTGGIIASVINLLATLIYDSIPVMGLNVLGFVIVLIIGHLFNLVISLFGAYINPLRLHYVEFLPKFYDAKGEKLATLKTEFKYLKLVY